MRRLTSIMSVTATAVLALGLCACGGEAVPVGSGSPAPGSGSSQEAGGGSSSEGGGSGGSQQDGESQAIEPITFTDTALGMTATCDQIIKDFNAPNNAATSSEPEDIYLIHCTMEFTGGTAYGSYIEHSFNLVGEDESSSKGVQRMISEDLQAAGLEPIDDQDYRSTHVDGWIAVARYSSDGPLPDNAVLTYDRIDLQDENTGELFPAFEYSAPVKTT